MDCYREGTAIDQHVAMLLYAFKRRLAMVRALIVRSSLSATSIRGQGQI